MAAGDLIWTRGLIPLIEPDVVAQILSQASDVAVIISDTGHVAGILANPAFKQKIGLVDLQGHAFRDALTIESIPKFESRLEEFLSGSHPVLPVELNHAASGKYPGFPIRYSFHKTGADGTILMLGNDLRATAEIQQQLIKAQIALEKDYEVQREFDTRFRVLMSSTSEALVFASISKDQIADCNDAACTLFGRSRESLIGTSFAQEFDHKGRSDVLDRLAEAATQQNAAPVNAKTKKNRRIVDLFPTLFRAAGDQMVLCRIQTSDGHELQADVLKDSLLGLYKQGIDAIVFVDAGGQILSANDSFINLADVTHAGTIKGRSLGDFLARGAVDLNVMLTNAARTGAMRLYATRLIGEHGSERAIEISTSHLTAGTESAFALIIRDASRVETVRGEPNNLGNVEMGSVSELIGNQSLREIVAKTTDVVEKICIEAAVEMTSNNRVAAAEMLGLSRQSLYVKLRKYGLINREHLDLDS